MLVAIIEYELNPGADTEFETHLAALLPRLSTIDGFLRAEPARSLGRPARLYEISYWRDAAALARWAADPAHARAMAAGRERLLAWYRIQVAEVVRDWSVGALPEDVALVPL
ncbi:MAG: antibiotic biosynthesis monooxygenase [Gammaproteobacteria bacterium]